MNAYEAARVRLEAGCQVRREAKRDRDEAEAYLLRAEAEWAGATRNLRQYETTPGIPLPQYREQVTA